MRRSTDNKQLRSFGLIVGGIFAVIGLLPVIIRAADPRWWSFALAAILICPALVYPKILLWPYEGWMVLGYILGWVNTRILLGVVFYMVVTPIGIVRRLFGKDPMGRQIRPEVNSYRVVRSPRPASHLTKQY